jgi:Spy/CpxP family protein refolding chaperone
MGGPWMLLSQASVAKELNLTGDQKSQIKKINEKSQTATRDLFDSMQDASPEERQEISKKLQSVTQETNKALEGALSENQVKRLKGIFLQFRGEQALRDAEIQDALGLTDDQKAKIRSPLAVLTDEQKTAFENMKGAKFDISSLRMGFGRGGFGPGGGPGGQGGGPGGPGGSGPRTRPPAAKSE